MQNVEGWRLRGFEFFRPQTDLAARWQITDAVPHKYICTDKTEIKINRVMNRVRNRNSRRSQISVIFVIERIYYPASIHFQCSLQE